MTKTQAIHRINESDDTNNNLNSKNTHWSNIVAYGADEGWWLNIPFHKFTQDLNLILNNDKQGVFIYVAIEANSIENPRLKFRNKENTADIFMPISGKKRLVDTQSGSSLVDFSVYPIREYNYAGQGTQPK